MYNLIIVNTNTIHYPENVGAFIQNSVDCSRLNHIYSYTPPYNRPQSAENVKTYLIYNLKADA